MQRGSEVRLAGVALLIITTLSGCLWYSGPRELERQKLKRGRVYKSVVFREEPGDDALPTRTLRETLEYWLARGADGKPRFDGVLAPEPENLYTKLLGRINQGETDWTLVSYQYDSVGLDALTLVDYIDSTGTPLGHDHVLYDEPRTRNDAPGFVGFARLRWWEYPQMVLEWPIDLAIGLKEFAGEIAKSPLSSLEAGWHGMTFERRYPVAPICFQRAAVGFGEDWRNGFTALLWRFRTHAPHTPLDTVRDLLGITPLLGPAFLPKSPPESEHAPTKTRLILVSQGIHTDSATEQITRPWEKGLEAIRPDVPATTSPYIHGSIADVTWSLLNISSGMGYDLAEQVAFQEKIEPGEAVEFTGFSGGVQRSIAATQALRQAGISVNRVVGISGPANGYSCALENHLVLPSQVIGDPVVLVELFTAAVSPFPSNMRILWMNGRLGHNTPYVPDPATRAPHRGYAKVLQELLGD